ncbi:MAG: hypothetical protein OEY79_02340 [Anaplasmataceae bacterium]|nr:hypothetical protein [Candidatus Heimdallarchaeota archaeon]MDH5796364.1 hypothetical protein [Anaplasmataceae bacterium]
MKSKKITIWSTKGGVGKTSICAELHFRLGWSVVTNERYTMLGVMIEENNLKILKSNEKIHNYEGNIIFDFGGYIDTRIVNAIEQSTCIIVPTSNSDIDIQGTIDTIYTVQKYNIPIVVIINRIRHMDDCQYTLESISKLGDFKYFYINESKAIFNLFRKKKSIINIIENKFMRYVYRNINIQFDSITSYINNI